MIREKLAKKEIRRIRAINTLMDLYAKEGRIGKVVKASKLRKDLFEEEADILIRFHIRENHTEENTEAVESEEEKLSKEKIYSLANATIGRLLINESVQEAKSGEKKLSEKEVDSLVNRSLEGGFIDEAMEVAELRERELSAGEIEKLAEAVRKGKDK